MTWNGPLKKIDAYRYEIPKDYKGEKNNLKMKTSAIIYADETMIPLLREDNAPEQVANVAMLPGIVGKSMAMPDIHWGYGFSIGGVAATDFENGVVSPGGVGFDINCISGDTKILMGDGSFEEIKNLNIKDNVFVFNHLKNKIEKSRIFFSLKKIDKTFEITTIKNYKLQLTSEHPIFTPDGMKELKYIRVGDLIGYYDERFNFDVVKSIKPKKIKEVFDISVSNPLHNFIANNFVVSNCGIRLVKTNLNISGLDKNKIHTIVDEMFMNVPSGLGSKARIRFSKKELEEIMKTGAKYPVEKGYGWTEDPSFLEENGCIDFADPAYVSNRAVQRGLSQVGSLGAGNHFLEIQKVDEIYDNQAAKAYGITDIGQICVMIHTGSRGFGHQVCTDHLQVLENAVKKYNIWLPDRQLACAPINSNEGQNYLKAMACAANFAWANRQLITHWVRESFEKVLNDSAENMGMHIVYDVCHNIAKIEEHAVDGKKIKVCVHRKGATRAFGPDKKEIPLKYRDIGQPVIIPGDMGTESYLLKGTKESKETFCSTCHGAGRVMSRHQALKNWRGEQIVKELGDIGIYVHPASIKVAAEEAPGAYKNIQKVVEIAHGAGLSKKVAKLKPLGVVKG
jgi:RNA-splicing ligase RtcB